jgi:very-short-patch-repair endonuclease
MENNQIITCEICSKIFYKNAKNSNFTKHIKKHSIQPKDYYAKYILHSNIPKCKYCNKSSVFISINKGFFKRCNSLECITKSYQEGTIGRDKTSYLWTEEKRTKIHNWHILHKNEVIERNKILAQRSKSVKCKEKRKNTLLKKYGIINSFQSEKSIMNREASQNSISKWHKELSWNIYNALDNKLKSSVRFNPLNNEFILNDVDKKTKYYSYDFTIKDLKLIVEFNGTYWHYHESLFPDENKEHRGITPKEYRVYWKKKVNAAIFAGYRVIEIWEHDYYKNKEEVFNKLMRKINENINI